MEIFFGGVPTALLVGFSDPGFLSKGVIYLLLTAISDAFLVYRCWVLWQRSWKAIVGPVLFIVGGMSKSQLRWAALETTADID